MRPKNSFTLIELLIVVAIIGILAAIAVPNFLNARLRAQLAEVTSTMRTMLVAVDMYRLDNGKIPVHYDDPNQNRWMTTPIAYASQLPYDIFANFTAGADDLDYADYGSNETRGCPHYQTYDKAYWIVSIGPDMVWQTLWKERRNSMFDMSNGLRSKGDIYVMDGTVKVPF
ncbi:MAG TPA: prepilin-type N-terminal cleavage/methylation domain-containing protein [bacterium]|nr:prepilin-type N-terminal cleavage/methylation domain-containing protein [bacterium]HPO09380.1 prepilin-type N-terminal cleavage/methylation domain-containing protein [bacterium]HQO35020.1 prepilin-type N-terminal cleavage/methylation domain-containing protein [bacterium]HQQ00407.1 prepilin-type N-terminal cleavage/methylation domain-containing protein [bacterium]